MSRITSYIQMITNYLSIVACMASKNHTLSNIAFRPAYPECAKNWASCVSLGTNFYVVTLTLAIQTFTTSAFTTEMHVVSRAKLPFVRNINKATRNYRHDVLCCYASKVDLSAPVELLHAHLSSHELVANNK